MDATPDSYDVFVSYSHRDAKWVHEWLLPRLEASGLKVLTDRDFKIGVPNSINIERAVEKSQHTIIVLTPAWVDNEWTEFEGLLVNASDPTGRKRKLIPVMLRQCRLPARIRMLTYADFMNEKSWNKEMSRLLRALNATTPELHIPHRSGSTAFLKNIARIGVLVLILILGVKLVELLPALTDENLNVFENFSRSDILETSWERWPREDIKRVVLVQEGGNQFLRFTPYIDAPAEVWRKTNSPILAQYGAIKLNINVNGIHFEEGEELILYLDQGNWKKVNLLSRGVTEASKEWQTIIIPLIAIEEFDKTKTVTRLGFRFWLSREKGAIDIDDITFIQ